MLYSLPMRYVSSLLVALALVWALAFTSREARAQIPPVAGGPSVTGILGAVQRCEPSPGGVCNNADNNGNHPHPNGVLVNVLNFSDCNADLYYEFQLGIAYPNPSYSLEVWAGTQDCSQLTNRQTSATSVCWPVAKFNAEATTNPTLLDVRMRDIASSAFTTTHPTTYAPATDPQICQSQTQTGASNLTLYIFFVDSGSNPVGTVQQYPITLDMAAGSVQGSISAGVGDTVLIVSVPPTTDPDTQGWNVYCDPPKGEESSRGSVAVDAASNNGNCAAPVPDSSLSDAIATDAVSIVTDSALNDAAEGGGTPGSPAYDDAGGNSCGVPLNDGSVPSPGGCSASSVLVPGNAGGTTSSDEAGTAVVTVAGEGGVATQGKQTVIDPKYLCGTGSATSTSINVGGLQDGFYYNLAVAAIDARGNVGPLSNVVCGEPVPVADFWRVYYDAGGRAGGGFCSADGVGTPAGTSGLGVLMVASMVAMARRRRRS